MTQTPAKAGTVSVDLAEVIPDSTIITDDEGLSQYLADYYWPAVVRKALGEPMGRPILAVLPRSERDVSSLLRFASVRGIPVVPWGGGSGTQGGSVPVRGGIILDLKSLNAVISVNTENYTVRAQAGKNGAELEAELNALGLMCPHYPASAEWATVGGYVAALGSGVLSTRYGKIEDLIVSLRAVLPSGEPVDSLPIPRHGAGPDAARLLIGSEGTLGVITEVTLRVIPLPASREFNAVVFPSVTAGIAAYREAIVKGLRPSVIRLYDPVATEQSLAHVIDGLDDLDGVISVEVYEGEPAIVKAERDVMLDIASSHGARLADQQIASSWWENRYAFYRPPHYPELPKMWGTLDVVAPYDALERAYVAVQEAVGERYKHLGLQLRTHFSHWYPWGAMFYGRFIIPDPGPNPLDLHDEIWSVGMQAVLDAGAVINDHHGVGLKLAPFMARQHGQNLRLLGQIKGIIDPKGIMNPGKLGLED
jgi:alkyldihydroxyacetonephosphate synthase